LKSILEEIVAHKRKEIQAASSRVSLDQLRSRLADAPSPRDFAGALANGDCVSLIAEVKQASPSRGLLRSDFDPVRIACTYADSGADCISVLTDERFFGGSLDHLRAIRAAVQVPLLRKDFILDGYQVVEARVAGADAVLLIAECLTAEELRMLHDQIVMLGMTPLVEFFEPENISKVLGTGARVIGINNRNLKTFGVDLNHSIELRKRLPADKVVVAESGIFALDDVRRLASAGIDAMLVGESLMRSDDIGTTIKGLKRPFMEHD
jgi:indole-3-glycerol phosphate synthase